MSLSPLHIIVVLLLILLLFGTGKLPRLMGDLAGGIKAFKKGMRDEKGDGQKIRGGMSSIEAPLDIDNEPEEPSKHGLSDKKGSETSPKDTV